MKREDDHWLARPTTIRLLIRGGLLVLGGTLLAEAFVPGHGHHGFDEFPGFAALFGFLVCVAMVLVAKGMGRILKRDEDDGDE